MLRAGEDCGGEPGELVALRWADVTSADLPLVEGNADSVPLKDCSAVVLAFRAPGAVVELPPAVSEASVMGDVGGGSFVQACDEPRGAGSPQAGPTTTAAPLIVPDGATRESFGFWLVGSLALAPCASSAVPSFDAKVCYTPADDVRLGAEVIKSAKAEERDGLPYVAIEFTDAGVLRWRELAGRAYTDRGQIAIEYGGVVLSAPTVNDTFSDTNKATISGSFSRDEARQLAKSLAG